MDRLLSFSPEPFELDFEFGGTLQMPIAPKCGYCGGELQCRQCNNHSTYFRRASHVLGVTDAPLESEIGNRASNAASCFLRVSARCVRFYLVYVPGAKARTALAAKLLRRCQSNGQSYPAAARQLQPVKAAS